MKKKKKKGENEGYSGGAATKARAGKAEHRLQTNKNRAKHHQTARSQFSSLRHAAEDK